MNPVAINTFDINFMKATFTLTNTIPQYVASNSGPWQIFEAKIRRYAAGMCGDRARHGTLNLALQIILKKTENHFIQKWSSMV